MIDIATILRKQSRISRANAVLRSRAERRLSRPNWRVPEQASSPPPPGDGTWHKFQFPGRGRSRGIARHQRQQYQPLSAARTLRDYQTSSLRGIATSLSSAIGERCAEAYKQYHAGHRSDSATMQFRLSEPDLIQFFVQPICEAIYPTAVVQLQVEGHKQ